MSNLTDFKAKAVIDSLNRMFKDKWFCITVVDNCMEVMGATQTSDYGALRLYHCKHFKDMDKKLKNEIYRITLENVTNVDDFPEIQLVNPSEDIDQELLVEKKPSILKRILRRSGS